MPPSVSGRFAPSDRKVLAVAAAILVLVVALTLAEGGAASSGGGSLPSTYDSSRRGARAAFLLLKETGYVVERWEKSPLELPVEGAGAVLVLAEPVFPAAEDERQALSRFVRTGGRIVATGHVAADLIPQGQAAPTGELPGEPQSFSPQISSPITLGANLIELEPLACWTNQNPAHLTLYGRESQALVVTYRLGAGRVVWWAGAWPLTNSGILSGQNLILFLNSIGQPSGVRVLWDEYFHGERGSLWAYLVGTPVPWAGAQIGLVALALLATYGRRWGPLRPRAMPLRLSPLEFVDTLGGLYERAHAAAPATGVALQRFRFLLTRRLGLPANYATAALGHEAQERLGKAAAGLAETLEKAEHAAATYELSDDKALELVRELDGYLVALRMAPGAPSTAVSSEASAQKERA
jgi:uncharacterized protein DUF4350